MLFNLKLIHLPDGNDFFFIQKLIIHKELVWVIDIDVGQEDVKYSSYRVGSAREIQSLKIKMKGMTN